MTYRAICRFWTDSHPAAVLRSWKIRLRNSRQWLAIAISPSTWAGPAADREFHRSLPLGERPLEAGAHPRALRVHAPDAAAKHTVDRAKVAAPHVLTIEPLDVEIVLAEAREGRPVATAENRPVVGGFGEVAATRRCMRERGRLSA